MPETICIPFFWAFLHMLAGCISRTLSAPTVVVGRSVLWIVGFFALLLFTRLLLDTAYFSLCYHPPLRWWWIPDLLSSVWLNYTASSSGVCRIMESLRTGVLTVAEAALGKLPEVVIGFLSEK